VYKKTLFILASGVFDYID